MDAYRIVWFDTEVNPQTNTITDIGAIDSQGNSFHNAVKAEFRKFLESADVVCGHNVIAHDLKFVGDCVPQQTTVVDTLPFSPIFPINLSVRFHIA